MLLESNMREGEEHKFTEQTAHNRYNRGTSLQSNESNTQNFTGRTIPSPNSEISSAAVAMLKLSESLPGFARSSSEQSDYAGFSPLTSSADGLSVDQNGYDDHGIHRRERAFVPDMKKDDHYWIKRKKNNEAAKKSREKRRTQDKMLAQQVSEVKAELDEVTRELEQVKRHFGYPVDLKFDPHLVSVLNKNGPMSPLSLSRQTDVGCGLRSSTSHVPKPVALIPSMSSGCVSVTDSSFSPNNSSLVAPILIAPSLLPRISQDPDTPYVRPAPNFPTESPMGCSDAIRFSPQTSNRDSQLLSQPSFEAQHAHESQTSDSHRSVTRETPNRNETLAVNDICYSPVSDFQTNDASQAFDYSARTLSGKDSDTRKRRHSDVSSHRDDNGNTEKQRRPNEVDSSSDEMSMVSQQSQEGSEGNPLLYDVSQQKGIPHKLRHKYNSISVSQDKQREEIANNGVSSETEQEVPLNMVIHDHSSRASSHYDSDNSSSFGESECDPKDSSYRERRQRNNEASRKCRRNKRMEQSIQKEIAHGLQEENSKLRGQMQYLSDEVHFLKELMYQRIEAQRKGVPFETPASVLEKVKNMGEANSS